MNTDVRATGAAVPPSERLIIFLVGAIQFVNIVDFMMVMPLGPVLRAGARDLDRASRTDRGQLHGGGGDRGHRRRRVSWIASTGARRWASRCSAWSAGTAAGAFAHGLASLVVARAIAGAFGGPATSIALSIVADAVPPARRGRAIGAVMGAFSVASVLGVPMGLRLAIWGGWRLPFIVVAGDGRGRRRSGAAERCRPMRGHIVGRRHAADRRCPRCSGTGRSGSRSR